MAIHNLKAYADFIDFIISEPTTEQIANYYLPADDQTRVGELLQANQDRRLTDAENAELDDYQALGRLIRRMKIAAHAKLINQKQEPAAL